MAWFKVDDVFADHPKVKSIPRSDRLAAVGLWTLSGVWCAKHLTNGEVPTYMLSELGGTPRLARALVAVGLWTPCAVGWQFHDWADHQPTKDQVQQRRKATADRLRKWRDKQHGNDSGPTEPTGGSDNGDDGNGSGNGVTNGVGNGSGNAAPVPSRPVPALSTYVVGKDGPVSNASADEPPTLRDESRSAPVDLSVMKIVRSYTSKVNPSNASNIAAHITNATATWDLDTIAKAVAKMAAEGRQLGADSLRIELNQLGPDKHGMQRFQDGSSVDWNTGRRTTKGGVVIGGGGYWSGKQQWSEG